MKYKFILFIVVIGVFWGFLWKGAFSEEQKPYLILITARIEKVDGDDIIINKGRNSNFQKDMFLTIHSFVTYMKYPIYNTGLAKVISVEKDKTIAKITWQNHKTYDDWDERSFKISRQTSISPDDFVIGTYSAQLTKEKLSKAKIILMISKNGYGLAPSNPVAFVCLLDNSIIIDTNDKDLEAKLVDRFGQPYIMPQEGFKLILPTTEDFFKRMQTGEFGVVGYFATIKPAWIYPRWPDLDD
ncbi:MAG: hypothetical protein V2A78_09360 [bacterium]